MGRELQKKKNRSSVPKIKKKPKTKRQFNPLGNHIIAQNWDRDQTLSQNYRRLGLASRLNAPTGGTERSSTTQSSSSRKSTTDLFAIKNVTASAITTKDVKVERDPETGKIIRVLRDEKKRANPLNDLLLTDDEEVDDDEDETEIVKQLKEQAANVAEKKPRAQSTREKEWLESLIARWGDNYLAMARDMKLNPMQQTGKDIERRIKKLRATEQASA